MPWIMLLYVLVKKLVYLTSIIKKYKYITKFPHKKYVPEIIMLVNKKLLKATLWVRTHR